MKIAIVTANYGGIDEIIPPRKQTMEYDYYCFDKDVNNKFFPKDGTNREKGKWVKLNLFNLFPNVYDYIVWIDGTVQITSSNFLDYIEDLCHYSDIGAVLHPDRATLTEEYDYLLKNAKKPYLEARYKDYDWASEIKTFSDKLDAKLYNPRLFVLKNTREARDFMENWSFTIALTTDFDQTQFSYIIDIGIDEKRVNVKQLYWDDLLRYCKINKHLKLM
jgi:hypothetical protein